MSELKEAEVLSSCLDYLKAKGFYVWRNNTGAIKVGRRFIRFGFPGSADILGILPDGRFFAVECKREKGGKISELQRDFLNAINDNNGVTIIANSLETLIENMKKLGII